MDFGFISTQVVDMFLYLSAPLVLVIFGNHSIRKRVSCKSKGVKFSLFSICFDFWGSVFKHRFLLSSGTDFSWMLASFRCNFWVFFVFVNTSGLSGF